VKLAFSYANAKFYVRTQAAIIRQRSYLMKYIFRNQYLIFCKISCFLYCTLAVLLSYRVCMYTIALYCFYRKLEVYSSGRNVPQTTRNSKMEAKEDIVMVQLHKPPSVKWRWLHILRLSKNLLKPCVISCKDVCVCVYIYMYIYDKVWAHGCICMLIWLFFGM